MSNKNWKFTLPSPLRLPMQTFNGWLLNEHNGGVAGPLAGCSDSVQKAGKEECAALASHGNVKLL